MLTRLTVVIISQYIQILNHYVIHLKLTRYILIIPNFKKKNGPILYLLYTIVHPRNKCGMYYQMILFLHLQCT